MAKRVRRRKHETADEPQDDAVEHEHEEELEDEEEQEQEAEPQPPEPEPEPEPEPQQSPEPEPEPEPVKQEAPAPAPRHAPLTEAKLQAGVDALTRGLRPDTLIEDHSAMTLRAVIKDIYDSMDAVD